MLTAGLETWPLGLGVRILKHDESGLVALDKPVGVRAHPNAQGVDNRALLRAPYDLGRELYRLEDGVGEVHLLNRLDAPTSGVILVTPKAPLAERVRRLFAERKVEKTYYAWVRGCARGLKEVWKDRYHTERSGGVVRASCGRGVEALTEVRCLRVTQSPVLASLLELRPKPVARRQERVGKVIRSLKPIPAIRQVSDPSVNIVPPVPRPGIW